MAIMLCRERICSVIFLDYMHWVPIINHIAWDGIPSLISCRRWPDGVSGGVDFDPPGRYGFLLFPTVPFWRLLLGPLGVTASLSCLLSPPIASQPPTPYRCCPSAISQICPCRGCRERVGDLLGAGRSSTIHPSVHLSLSAQNANKTIT